MNDKTNDVQKEYIRQTIINKLLEDFTQAELEILRKDLKLFGYEKQYLEKLEKRYNP